MNEWIKSFVGCLLIISVAMQMLPNSKYEHYVRLFTGLMMLVLLIQPILKIGSADVYLEGKISEAMEEQERLEKEIVVQSKAFESESREMQKNELQEIYIPEIERVEVEVTMDD
jgi:stage III sporulation protein AF